MDEFDPSARLELEFEDSSGEAAAEGTAAHELGEHKLREALKISTKKPTSIYDSEEMERYTDEYVQFILEELAAVKQITKDPLLLIEQRLDFSNHVQKVLGQVTVSLLQMMWFMLLILNMDKVF
ncbi:DUF2800 domain-containing protein [Virgibacillus soli]|uniref:DUF2800 domain-containing protein n=1 Tax=Paracerasibacillus soli TaxID=480284 RepID=A0ABU5CYR7_9BACI|nr:DUF2800 domain-containing protein [Virgibacillus soli]MDY0410620.1 DUF2800 domain-containing protein [Virgibacillus soli]